MVRAYPRPAAENPPGKLLAAANDQCRLGIDRGRYAVPDDFDAPLPDDVIAAFER